jgi:hypothetical protein
VKKCYKCKQEFPKSEFYKSRRNNDGLQDMCKGCNNKRNKENYQKNPVYYKTFSKERASKINEYLSVIKSKPCTDCHNIYHPVCMDFDHIYGKEKAVSVLRGRSIERIMEEIVKCELVCANCHRLRTFKRKMGLKNVSTFI